MDTFTTRPSWKRRLGIGLVDLLALVVTIPACYIGFIIGAFASDSGTGTATTIAYTIIGVSGLYFIATLVLITLSQVKNSYKLALLPIVIPVLLYLWISLS